MEERLREYGSYFGKRVCIMDLWTYERYRSGAEY